MSLLLKFDVLYTIDLQLGDLRTFSFYPHKKHDYSALIPFL